MTAALQPPDAETPPPRCAVIRVIIADDQEFQRELLKRILKREADIEVVETCPNGRAAVDAINRLQPQVAFLDVQMPELDGFQVVSEIPPDRMPAIVFVTANHELAVKAFELQALDFVPKPFTREQFQNTLQRVRKHLRLPEAAAATSLAS
jgi:two-component system, LytTR family, response regulator